MNTNVATLTADLILKQDQFERALGNVHGQLSTLGNTLRVITGAAAGLFAFGQVKAGMENVVGAAVDLESKLSQVRKTTGLAGSDLGALRTQLEGLASTVGGMKFDELLGLASVGGRLGITGDKVGNFARDMGMIPDRIGGHPRRASRHGHRPHPERLPHGDGAGHRFRVGAQQT